ncbi:hypothetical protein A0H81_13372 [Grifola frondosa]|uniref:Uncharacterized protein n=1 Tax=Grifola frondosa TaxID=5627 RepID=A0A1C7LPD4_GRIFR|nr:hypothetical protein A0H81_13372 [Grifola frondosa]
MWDDAGNRLQLKIEGRRLAARRCGIIVLREMGTGKKVGAVIGIDCSSAHHAEPRLVVDLVTEDTPSWPEMPQGDDKTACSILHQYQHAPFINGEIASLHKRFFQRSQTFEFGLIHIIVDNSIGSEGEPRVFSVRLYVESPPHFMGQVLMDFLTCLLRELLRNNEALGWYFTMWLEMDSDNEQAFKVIAHGRAAPQEEISGSSLWELYVDKVHFGDKRPPLDFEVDRPSWTVAESLEILPIVAYWIESRRLFR